MAAGISQPVGRRGEGGRQAELETAGRSRAFRGMGIKGDGGLSKGADNENSLQKILTENERGKERKIKPWLQHRYAFA